MVPEFYYMLGWKCNQERVNARVELLEPEPVECAAEHEGLTWII